MSQQTPITNYFKAKALKSARMELKPKKRKLSLNRVPKENVIVLSSDDEETNNSSASPKKPLNLSQASDGATTSDSSNRTIIYSPSLSTPRKTPTSDTKRSKAPNSKATNSPSSSKKFFSPNKKRSVQKKSPTKVIRNLATEFASAQRLIKFEEDESYVKACEGQDDKTKFLLKIVHDFVKDDSLRPLLEEDAVSLLSNYLTLPKPAAKLVCRLYWRKNDWYKRDQLIDICKEGKADSIDDPSAFAMFEALLANNFLLAGTNQNISFKEFTSILKADELKEICKNLKIKTQSKKGAVESLTEFCQKTSISSYFTSNNTPNNKIRVLQIMSQKAGTCYRLSEFARGVLDRLYLLTYLGIDYSVIREKRLELMLINEKIERETFPLDTDMVLDNASIVFANIDEFERYFFAHIIYEDFISKTDCEERCNIVIQVLQFYNDIDEKNLIRYKALPLWLQRFTPPSIYIKIFVEGLVDLKKGKVEEKCQLACEILSLLLDQDFRVHKKATWYAEKALILHSYLNRPKEAAQVLLKGFESSLSEEAKDAMRPRAKKIAQQKNIMLDETVRLALLDHANREAILECDIPSRHFYKQPMDNITKGKAMYETKNENGRLMQGVEEYAISCYLLNEEYTGGGHWEGRIITTMFFLLFWDAIYSKPRGVTGIFLSRYQIHPLDMFCEDFYTNRRMAIDARLSMLEECSGADVVEILNFEMDNRPETELSGINHSITRDSLCSVAAALGGRRLAALCGRLARDYRYSHSGFPDLTLWHDKEKKVKFVEVKSDSDKPSVKQLQWLEYLRRHDIDAEFCYVGAHTDRVKARGKKTQDSGS